MGNRTKPVGRGVGERSPASVPGWTTVLAGWRAGRNSQPAIRLLGIFSILPSLTLRMCMCVCLIPEKSGPLSEYSLLSQTQGIGSWKQPATSILMGLRSCWGRGGTPVPEENKSEPQEWWTANPEAICLGSGYKRHTESWVPEMLRASWFSENKTAACLQNWCSPAPFHRWSSAFYHSRIPF